ncbi:MAG: hypothetical protein QOE55_8015 [Acidobacteriaceae bacterium]|nr:hypothetical protein [Acidobacteriaceae bacterium]
MWSAVECDGLFGLGLLGWCGWELADFDVAEGDGKAVVLQEEVAVVGFAKVAVDVELAGGDEGAELGGNAVVLDDLDAVQPVLSVGSADDDAGGVPLAYGPDWLRSCCGDQVVEGGHSAVAIAAFLGVGVEGVVQDLVLEADVGTVASVARSEGGVDEVLDAGVCARGNAEVDGELEVGVLACAEDVAGVAAFFATVLSDGEEAVFDLPSGGGKVGAVGAVPA